MAWARQREQSFFWNLPSFLMRLPAPSRLDSHLVRMILFRYSWALGPCLASMALYYFSRFSRILSIRFACSGFTRIGSSLGSLDRGGSKTLSYL